MIKLSDSFSLSDLKEEDFINFKYGWDIQDTVLAKYFLGISDSQIFYSARIYSKPDYDINLKTTDFTERLWERDVIELFIGDPEKGCYQEFNIAPSGAWWSAYFTKYRSADKSAFNELSCIKTEGFVSPTYWQASMVLPIRELSFKLNPDKVLANPAAISGKNPRSFFSAKPIISEQPDFHLFLS